MTKKPVADKSNQVEMFARRSHDWMERVIKGSLNPVEVAQAVQQIIDRGGSFIYIDYCISPSFPKDFVSWAYPKLQSRLGSTEYYIGDLEQWRHPSQESSNYVTGDVVLKYLEDNGMLESCCGVRDLEEIQKKGIAFFRKYFAGQEVMGWKSVAIDKDGHRSVPYLYEYEHDGKVQIAWSALDYEWHAILPALRRAS